MGMLEIILIAAIAVIVFGMIVFLFAGSGGNKKRSIEVIQGQATKKGKVVSAADEQDKRRAEISRKLKQNKSQEERDKKKATMSMKLAQAGLGISVKQFWFFSFLSMAIAAGFCFLIGMGTVVIALVAVTALLGFPRLVVGKLIANRQKKFLEEFPDALEAMVRLLKAGMPVSEAVAMISKEFTGPVGEEMSMIYDQQSIGVPLHEAALHATNRMPISEMQMFATGLAIQAQTGSSLSEVLLNLSNVIRARFRLKRKIKALSSEAIASAGIIGAMPILLAFGMYFANREYIMILFEDSFGNILLAGAVIWMCIGVVVMRAMINFKI